MLSAVVFFIALSAWIYWVLKDERQQAQWKSDAKSKEVAEAAETHAGHLKCIAEASAKLPDTSAAITQLKHRFTWQQIMESAGYRELHVQLLRRVGSGASLTLPNLNCRILGEMERETLAVASRTLHDQGLYQVPLDVGIQEPTTDVLSDLVLYDLVTCTPDVSNRDRDYVVYPTPEGASLIDLNRTFSSYNYQVPKYIHLSKDVSDSLRLALTQVIHTQI